METMKTGRRGRHFWTLAAMLPLVLPLAARRAPARHKVFGDPLAWHWAPSRTYHVENYRLALHFNQEKGEVFGDEVITLTPFRGDFRRFWLNSVGLTIDSVSLVSVSMAAPEGAKTAPTPLRYQRGDTRLTIDLNRAYAAGAAIGVRIVYHGTPQTGLFFINPDKYYPNAPKEIWSQGESEFNRYWYPSWDYPNDKATSEMIITVPKGQVAVSNGRLEQVKKHGGEVTYDWVERVPHSSYLNSVAIGPWRKVEQHYKNIPVDYYVPRYISKARALRSFGLTPDMIGFYSTTFGVEYPYAKYAQTAVRNFTDGGMENISATTQTEWTLHSERADADFKSTGLVAHELAHQWFGDLVTTLDWADLWLNEGFAQWIEALYTEHHDGNDAYRYEIWQDQRQARQEDDYSYRRPIVSRHYVYPEQMFDSTTYSKGAAVLDMLRYVLGDRAYFAALHHYLVVNREKTVDTQDLMQAVREATGRNLDWFFHEWVFRGGYPQYRVRTRYEAAESMEVVTVEQTQKVNAITPLFDMPVEIDFHGVNGSEKKLRVRVSQASQSFYVTLKFRPLWTDFDPNDRIYKTLDYQPPIEAVIEQAEHDPDMMSRLWATRQLGRRATQAPDAVLTALSHVLENDSFDGVRAAATHSLGEFGGDEARVVLLATLNDKSDRVRAAAAEALSHFHGDHQAGEALTRALKEDPSYLVEMTAAASLGRMQAPQAYQVLKAALKSTKNQNVLEGILVGLTASQHDGAERLLLNEARAGVPERVRIMAMRMMPHVGDQVPADDAELKEVVDAGLADPFSFVQNAAMRMVGEMQLNQYRPQLEQLRHSLPTPDQRHDAQEALDRLDGRRPQPEWIGAAPSVRRLERQVDQLERRVRALGSAGQ